MEKSTEEVKLPYENKKPALLQLYPYIVAWGQMLGSYGYYIEDQVSLALEQKASRGACFIKNGVWNTTEGMRPELVAELDEYINGKRGGTIPHWYPKEETPENLKPYIYGNS